MLSTYTHDASPYTVRLCTGVLPPTVRSLHEVLEMWHRRLDQPGVVKNVVPFFWFVEVERPATADNDTTIRSRYLVVGTLSVMSYLEGTSADHSQVNCMVGFDQKVRQYNHSYDSHYKSMASLVRFCPPVS